MSLIQIVGWSLLIAVIMVGLLILAVLGFFGQGE